jgi:DNA invertase Pin-like site-specific DNA recombinase
MNVALYLRVSTDKQEADNQRMQLRQLCVAQNWRIVREYQDNDSGSRADLLSSGRC